MSPPLANACMVVLAFSPRVANALVVDLEPSFARMLNSLTGVAYFVDAKYTGFRTGNQAVDKLVGGQPQRRILG